MEEIIIEGEMNLIGAGGVSKVYECKINSISTTDLVILKVGCNVKNNIENYQFVKSLGLPTLSFVKEELFKGKTVLITEHLNSKSEVIYVTPNSVISDEMKLLQAIYLYRGNNIKEKFESIAEQFRYQNKLSEIPNFTDFINATINDLKHASISKIVIEYDSYFIGSLKNKSTSDIHYKIADLDHIFKCEDKTKEECLELNISEFKRALATFLDHFVIEGNNKIEYEEIINQINTLTNS
jgi:hypothetical protein|nr:hypothetical protein [uncultured Flavobacterium sp.]